MAERIKISEDLTLYSGDVITMRAFNGTYLKRYFGIKGKSVIESYNRKPDKWSEFVVTVVGENEIYLQAENGKYLKRWESWRGMSIISIEHDEPDAWSTFIVEPTDVNGWNNTIILRSKDNGNVLKFFDGDSGRGVMVYTNKRDRFAPLTVNKIGTKCREVVEDIIFEMPSAVKEERPEVIVSQEIINATRLQQTQTFKVEKTVETSKTFTWEAGFSLSATTAFTAGIPLAAANTTEVGFETYFSAGGTKSNAETKSFEAIFPVVCPPRRKITAKATIQKGTVSVNFKSVIARYIVNNRGNKTKYTYEVPGVFKSVNAYDLQVTMEESRYGKL